MTTTKIAMIKATLKYTSQEELIEAMRPLISPRGMFIRTRSTRPVGAEVRFEFKLADGSITYAGEGTVRKEIPFVGGPSSQASGMLVALRKVNRQFKEVVDAVIGEQRKSDRDATPTSMPAVKMPESQGEQPDKRNHMIVDSHDSATDGLDLFGELDMDEGLDFLFSGIGKKEGEGFDSSSNDDGFFAPAYQGNDQKVGTFDFSDFMGDNFDDAVSEFDDASDGVAFGDDESVADASRDLSDDNLNEVSDPAVSYPAPELSEGANPFASPASTLVGFPSAEPSFENVTATPVNPVSSIEAAIMAENKATVEPATELPAEDNTSAENESSAESNTPVEETTDASEMVAETAVATDEIAAEANVAESVSEAVAENVAEAVAECVSEAEAVAESASEAEAVAESVSEAEAVAESAVEEAVAESASDVENTGESEQANTNELEEALTAAAEPAPASMPGSESPSEIFEAIREQMLEENTRINERAQTIAEAIAQTTMDDDNPAPSDIKSVEAESLFNEIKDSITPGKSTSELIGNLVGDDVPATASPVTTLPPVQLPPVPPSAPKFTKLENPMPEVEGMSLSSLTGGKAPETPAPVKSREEREEEELSLGSLVKRQEANINAAKPPKIDLAAMPRKERKTFDNKPADVPTPKKGLLGRLFGK